MGTVFPDRFNPWRSSMDRMDYLFEQLLLHAGLVAMFRGRVESDLASAYASPETKGYKVLLDKFDEEMANLRARRDERSEGGKLAAGLVQAGEILLAMQRERTAAELSDKVRRARFYEGLPAAMRDEPLPGCPECGKLPPCRCSAPPPELDLDEVDNADNDGGAALSVVPSADFDQEIPF